MAWVRCCGGKATRSNYPIVNSNGQFVGASYAPSGSFYQGSDYFEFKRINGATGKILSMPVGYHYLIIKGYGINALSNLQVTYGNITRTVGGAGGVSVTAIIDISAESNITELTCHMLDHDNTAFRFTELYFSDNPV